MHTHSSFNYPSINNNRKKQQQLMYVGKKKDNLKAVYYKIVMYPSDNS